MKKQIFILGTLLGSVMAFSQVGVNTSTPQATMDVMVNTKDTSKPDGFIAPRLKGSELSAKDALYLSPQTGAIVYVTEALVVTTAKTVNVTSIGYYYFDGTVWLRFNPSVSAGTNNWSLTGNAGTTPDTNFLGTTDNQALMFKTNNVQSGYIANLATNGNTGLGYNTMTGSAFSSSTNPAKNNITLGANTLSSANASSVLSNIAIGNDALSKATDSNNNVAIGDKSQGVLTIGSNNVSVGSSTLAAITTGKGNNAFGLTSLNTLTTGNGNIGLGQLAGSNITTGSYNIVIGNYNNQVPKPTGNRQLNIGNLITGTGLSAGTDTEANATAQEKILKIGIAQTSDKISEVLDVNGTTRVRSLPVNGAANAVYTKSDGTTSATQDQTFNATRTVVADANGVLGYVEGIPSSGSIGIGQTISRIYSVPAATAGTSSFNLGTYVTTNGLEPLPVMDGLQMNIQGVDSNYYDPRIYNVSSSPQLVSYQTFATQVNENKTLLNLNLSNVSPNNYTQVDNNNLVYWSTSAAEVETTNLQVQIDDNTYRWYELKWWCMQIGTGATSTKKIFLSITRKA